MSIEVIEREIVFQGHAFNVRRDQVQLPNQIVARLEIIDHPGAVTILPLDADGQILFVRQYRHAVGMELLELPAGTLREGEPPEACALREMREETGYAAGKIVKLSEFYLAPGYSTEHMTVYLATELLPDPLPRDADELITLERVPVKQAYEMALNGELQDGKSLAALLLVRDAILAA
ncbi:MAG: NUDIX hydrolase [Acidobacteriaceae bacterium]